MLRKLSVIPALAIVALFSLALTAHAAGKGEKVEGKVSSVNADAKTFMVKAADGKESEIGWNDKTKLAWHPESKEAAPTAADVKEGADVTVTAEKDAAGKWMAAEIDIHKGA
jgi:hypothetical protein